MTFLTPLPLVAVCLLRHFLIATIPGQRAYSTAIILTVGQFEKLIGEDLTQLFPGLPVATRPRCLKDTEFLVPGAELKG